MTSLLRHYGAPPSGTTTVSVSDREKIMYVLANPGAYGREVRQAVQLLIAAGRSTADPFINWRPASAGLTGSLDSLLDLMNDALIEITGMDVHCVHPDAPQYVPSDWAETLEVRAVEDNEYRLPWLDDH